MWPTLKCKIYSPFPARHSEKVLCGIDWDHLPPNWNQALKKLGLKWPFTNVVKILQTLQNKKYVL